MINVAGPCRAYFPAADVFEEIFHSHDAYPVSQKSRQQRRPHQAEAREVGQVRVVWYAPYDVHPPNNFVLVMVLVDTIVRVVGARFTRIQRPTHDDVAFIGRS